MEAKNELTEVLCLLFPGAEAREKIRQALTGYTVAKESESGRSNLRRRIAACRRTSMSYAHPSEPHAQNQEL